MKFVIKVMLDYIGKTFYQFLETKVVLDLRKKKDLPRLSKEYDLEITAESNQNIVNYLDVTLNLKDGTFRP